MAQTKAEWSKRYMPWELPALPNESEEALKARRNHAYFEWQIGSVQEFWRRIGQELDVTNTRVIELGCGHGTLSVDLAKRGAAEIIGLDLDDDRIEFAQNYIPEAYTNFSGNVRFICQDIGSFFSDLKETFDFIFSKDTFEPVLDLESVVGHIWRLLKPGGQLVIGTSPLYFSPFGDHSEYFGRRFPWAGIIPESILFHLASWRNGKSIRSAGDVGLNKMTPVQFRSLFPPSAWRIDSIRYNVGDKPLISALRALRNIPPFEKYFTVSIYSVITML